MLKPRSKDLPHFFFVLFLLAKFKLSEKEKSHILQENMASDGDSMFPAADAEGELNPGQNKKVAVDPVSSDIATSREFKEQKEVERKLYKKGKKDALETLKTTILVSAIVVAVAGAAFAITKRLREN